VTTLMSDDGTGKTNGTALDTAKWTTEGSTAGGGSATYQSTALKFQSGNQGGYAGTSRTSRSFNITSVADIEISGTFTHDTNEAYPLIMVRATTSTVDYPNGYYLQLRKGSTLVVGKLVSYSGTDLSSVSKTISASTTYGFRFQVIGNALKARVWTGSEPGTWDISITDSSFTSAGKAGITIGAGNAAVNHAVTFDNIVVTDGASLVDKGPGTETMTLTDAGSVFVSVNPVSGAETMTLADAASMTANAGTGTETMTLADDAALSVMVSATSETGTLVDAASLEVFQLHHELKVEIEFTPGVWTDVSDRVVAEVESQATFGRPTRFDDVAASTFRFTLRNSDGALTIGNPNSPYYPNVEKGFGVRSSVLWAGQSYPLFWGQAVDIDMPAITSADSATVTIQCADAMASLERKTLLSPWVEEARRVARYAVTDGWCDVFPFPASSVKTETSVQVADTSFDNKGVLGTASVLGSCFVVPAANGGGVCRSTGVDGNGGALTEGTLDFEIGDNGSGRQTHPILKFTPQVGFQQFELLFKVPPDVMPPIYATGTHTVTAGGDGWNTIRDTYGLTFDELRLLNPELPDLSALAVGQVVNVATDGKAGSEWVLAQFFAGSTEMLRVCLTNNAGKMSLITRNPSTGGAGFIWNSATLADGKWRKLTIYKSGTNQVRSNINDSPSGQTTTSLPADLASVTTVYVGGRVASASATAGGQTQCPEFSVGGAAFHKQSGVWSYYVLGAPPANITARQRLVELGQYAYPVQVSVASYYNNTIDDPFGTLVVRTDITGRTVLECMQELARTVGAYLWVEPGTGVVTMRKGPTEPLRYLPIDLEDDVDDANPPRWRNTIDSEPTRVTAKCPAGETTSINAAAESRGLYRAVSIDTCAATVAAAKSVADRYVGGSGTLHLTNLQVDLVHAGLISWGTMLTSFLPTEVGIRATNTVPEVTGFDTIDSIIESWTFTSTVDSAKFAFETTPIKAYNSPSLPGFTVTASTGSQTDGTVTVPQPSGTAAGDYLVAIATTDETGTLAGLKAGGTGWTEQGSGATSDAGVGKVWTRTAGASEPSSYTFTVDGSNGSQALMSDDLSGTNGSAVDSSKWTAGEVRTGASFTRQDGYGLMNPGTNTGYTGRVIYRVNTPNVADVDVVWSYYFGDGDSYHWMMVRATSNVGGELVSGYEIRPSVGADTVGVRAITNFAVTADYGTIPLTMAAGTWYRCRVQISGSTLKVKAWPAGSPEPAAWGMTQTTTVFTAAGQIGFACGGGNGSAARIRIDDVEVTSPNSVQAGYPEASATVLRVSGVDPTTPIVATPVWGSNDATTGDHVAPDATMSAAGLQISHWHIVSDGDPVSGGGSGGGGGGGTSAGFSFGMSGFGSLTETGGSTELTNVNNWLTNKSLKAVGTWADSDATVQQEQWGIGSGERFGGWNGIIDIAFGGVFGSETWAQAASGTFDTRWQNGLDAIASKWGSRDKGLLHLRFAHEFNGSFSEWAVTDSGDMSYTNFKTAWIRWANKVRATLPGAQIVWSPNDGTSSLTNVDNAYPGSAYVDVIGPDTYNAWPHVTNAAEWTTKINLVDGNGNPEGIEAWRQYALGKGKPLALPEWGNPAVNVGGAGGGDDAYWAEQTIAWCKANGGSGAGQVKYAVYFNIGTAGGYPPDYLIYAGASGEYGTVRQPNVAAAIRANA